MRGRNKCGLGKCVWENRMRAPWGRFRRRLLARQDRGGGSVEPGTLPTHDGGADGLRRGSRLFVLHHGSIFRVGVGVRPANAVVALGVQFVGKFHATGFHDASAEHDVREVGRIVFQQFVVVGDDQETHVLATDFGDAFAR